METAELKELNYKLGKTIHNYYGATFDFRQGLGLELPNQEPNLIITTSVNITKQASKQRPASMNIQLSINNITYTI